ncbi:MAG: hypothetical protein H0T54_05215 [Geodermatophilaceae bacterium]|nr:hypothetical protein [Geodermatophilaceae bacterium]
MPDGSPLDEGVVVFALGNGLLNLEDLSALGERALPWRGELGVTSGLDGLCGTVRGPAVTPLPDGAVAGASAAGAVEFILASASLSEIISADLDTLAASTLRGRVQLAQDCPSSNGLTLQTDGIINGIGDEYAVFTVERTAAVSGVVETGFVVLVRVGGRLIEVSLTPEGAADVPDGLHRALRIAEAAVGRMLAG